MTMASDGDLGRRLLSGVAGFRRCAHKVVLVSPLSIRRLPNVYTGSMRSVRHVLCSVYLLVRKNVPVRVSFGSVRDTLLRGEKRVQFLRNVIGANSSVVSL